jgi:hypothetical protein
LETVGGPAYLSSLTDGLPRLQNIDHYLRLLHDKTELRRVIHSAQAIITAAQQDPENVAELLNWATSQVSTASFTAKRTASVWDLARTAPDVLSGFDPEQDWLWEPFLAPGSITEFFSPRGLGKSHVAAHLAVSLARQDKRVLLLDRDNSKREVIRRLRAWGGADALLLKVMTRNQTPPLTDQAAWAVFPFADCDVVILDSLDSSAEGVGEADSAKPSRAVAPLLDIAHRPQGPAILILGNTVKSGKHGRGSGVVEDRADICFEVRDATDLKPTGTKPWWEELPPAGAGAWAQRASRRKHRDSYRLAFIPSKFRIGEEPDPFILELDLSGETWTVRDVTAEVEAAVEAKDPFQGVQQRLADAESQLAKEVQKHAEAGQDLLTERDAIPSLLYLGLTRGEARKLVQDGAWKGLEDRVAGGTPRQPKGFAAGGPGRECNKHSGGNNRIPANANKHRPFKGGNFR